jgi:hypothetical protein
MTVLSGALRDHPLAMSYTSPLDEFPQTKVPADATSIDFTVSLLTRKLEIQLHTNSRIGGGQA